LADEEGGRLSHSCLPHSCIGFAVLMVLKKRKKRKTNRKENLVLSWEISSWDVTCTGSLGLIS
jgi:hypothetical protein